MTPEKLAEILQQVLCDRMEAWDMLTGQDLRKMPWEQLDPVSRRLYIERAAVLLGEYDITPKAGARA